MTVEGPAEILVKSACREGAVRVAPSREIVDLDGEFGLPVRGGKEHVEVFDGEVDSPAR